MDISSSVPTMGPSSANIAGRAQPVPPIVTTDTSLPAPDPSVPHKIHYLEDGVQEDANYRVQWSNWMSDGQKKSIYKHVFVLLLSWHPECDDMAVEAEVTRLEVVFRDKYNYEVESFQIDSRKKIRPQAQANAAVANFVKHHDEEEDSLFIVYYAGHGSPGKMPGDLKISGRRRQDKQKLSQQFSHITWNLVESNLKETQADVLLIFDCCHASDLGRESVLNSRSFEYLAASTSPYTRSPGDQSFTSALIWALEKLAQPPTKGMSQESPMFTTSKLAKTICDAQDFPAEQKPSLISRDTDAWQHIILAPLPREGAIVAPAVLDGDEEDDEEEPDETIPQFLSLTFHFKEKQDEAELKRLADHLKKYMKVDKTSLYKVQWGAIWGGSRPAPGSRFREAVGRVMAHAQTPVSATTKSLWPLISSSVQGNRLLPPEHQDSPGLSTERTPLLSDTSSITFEEEDLTCGIWSLIVSFSRDIWGSRTTAPKQRQNDTSSDGNTKTSMKWTTHLNKLRIFSNHSSTRIRSPS